MRRALARLLLALLVLPAAAAGSAALVAHAEDEPAEALSGAALDAQVARWIEGLRSDRFEAREAARLGLQRVLPQARLLLEAVRDDEDPEVRRTVRTLLAGTEPSPTVVPAHVRGLDLERMGRVSLSLQARPLREALAALGRQMDAHFEVPEAAAGLPVTLEVREAPCFGVLRQLLEAGNLRMTTPFDAAGNTELTVADDTPVPPWAVSGPLLIEVLEVMATRALNAKGLPKYALQLQLQWAPSVQVAQYDTPRVEVARDKQTNAFRAGADMGRRVSYGVSRSSHSARVTVHLEPIAAECGEVLGVLELVLPITRLQHDLARVRLDDTARLPICLDPRGDEAQPDRNEAVQFHALDRSDDGRGQWVADLSATLFDEVAQRTLQSFFVDEDGRLQPLYVYGGLSRSADGTVRVTARALRSAAARPPALEVTWYRVEEAGTLRFRLKDIPLR